MNVHLYVVQTEIGGEKYMEACVGDQELSRHMVMAEHCGGRLSQIYDAEFELRAFVWECCFDGMSKGWINDA